MREINKIIIHCSDSGFGDVATIDRWHKEKGFDCIGYHYVNLNSQYQSTRIEKPTDGQLQFGRPVQDVGAHCYGQNDDSIGICLIGGSFFTQAQMRTLKHLVESLMCQYDIPSDEVYGHSEFSTKTCPNFDVDEWVENELLAPEKSVERVVSDTSVNIRLQSLEDRVRGLEEWSY